MSADHEANMLRRAATACRNIMKQVEYGGDEWFSWVPKHLEQAADRLAANDTLLRRVLSEYLAGNRIVDGYWYSPERGTSPDLPPAADVLAWIHSHDHGEVAYPTDHTYRVIVEATLAAIEDLSLPSDETGAPHYRNDPATADEVALIDSLKAEVGLDA